MLFEQYQWKSCLIIHQNDEFGYNGMQLLTQNFTIDFRKTLKFSLSRIVIVWANEISTRQILLNALQLNLIGHEFLWILTTTIPLQSFSLLQQENLIGILTIESSHSDSFSIKSNPMQI